MVKVILIKLILIYSDNIDLMESNGIELISLIQVTKPVLVIFRFFNVDTDLIYIINVLALICQGVPKHVVRFHHVSICFYIFSWLKNGTIGTIGTSWEHVGPCGNRFVTATLW